MSPTDLADTHVRIELWVWPDRDALDDRRDLVLRRLERLQESGVVNEVDVHEWSHQINLDSAADVDPEDLPARTRLMEFTEWARHRGVSLPIPDPTRAGSGRLGPEYVAQDMPRMMLAEYRDGELDCVAPHRADGEKHTIEDHLKTLGE
ncbi:MAG: HTH domain-containing protein [Salinigranum sp.]